MWPLLLGCFPGDSGMGFDCWSLLCGDVDGFYLLLIRGSLPRSVETRPSSEIATILDRLPEFGSPCCPLAETMGL